MNRRVTDHEERDYSHMRHSCDKEKAFEEIKTGLSELKKLLIGNGVVGVAEMARRSFEWMQATKNTRQGHLDWLFRAIIAILLGYIAVRVGLK